MSILKTVEGWLKSAPAVSATVETDVNTAFTVAAFAIGALAFVPAVPAAAVKEAEAVLADLQAAFEAYEAAVGDTLAEAAFKASVAGAHAFIAAQAPAVLPKPVAPPAAAPAPKAAG